MSAGSEARTDVNGRFTLRMTRLRAVLEASHEGYEGARIPVEAASDPIFVEVSLTPRTRFHDRIEVRADPLGEGAAFVPVHPAEVMTVAGGAENVFRVLTTLPGVAATDELTSRLSVRGGGPDQNLTVMDGVEIHDPYRLFGLVSAFNPDTVEDFELITGAFSAKYGDRLSSILLIDNREGSSLRTVSGSSALSLTNANTVVEGALPRKAGSWILSGRRTYYDLVAERFTDSDLPSFGDVQGKLSWDLRNGSRLTMFGLYSREGTDALLTGGDHMGTFYTRTNNDVLSATFAQPIAGRGLWSVIASYSRTGDDKDIDGRFQGGRRRSNTPDDNEVDPARVIWNSVMRIRDLSMRQELSVAAFDRHLLESGVELHRLSNHIDYRIEGNRNAGEANGSSIRGGAGLDEAFDSRRRDVRLGAWLIDRLRIGRQLKIDAGVRLDYCSINGDTELQPRVQTALALTPATRLKLAVGRHTQSPGYEKLASADYFMNLSGGGRLPIHNERSTHGLLSLEHELAPGIVARIEGYYKSFDNLILGRLETPEETQRRVAGYDFPLELSGSIPSKPIITSTPDNGGSGRAYGLDFYLERRMTSEKTRLSGWASFTWSRADRTAYGRTFPFDYDRRRLLNLVGQLRASRRLELAVTGRFASGFPTTPVVGLSVSPVADERDIDGDGDRDELVPERDKAGRLVYIPDLGGVENMNTARQPAYARVDARLTFAPHLGRKQLKIYVDVINVFNHENVGMLEYELEHDPGSDQPRLVESHRGAIPFLPSIGIHYRF